MSTTTAVEQIATAAQAHGWEAAPIGNVGTLYSRNGETLRVLFTTSNAQRRTVREWEHERPAGPGRPAFLNSGGAATAGKRATVVAILEAPVEVPAAAPTAGTIVRYHGSQEDKHGLYRVVDPSLQHGSYEGRALLESLTDPDQTLIPSAGNTSFTLATPTERVAHWRARATALAHDILMARGVGDLARAHDRLIEMKAAHAERASAQADLEVERLVDA